MSKKPDDRLVYGIVAIITVVSAYSILYDYHGTGLLPDEFTGTLVMIGVLQLSENQITLAVPALHLDNPISVVESVDLDGNVTTVQIKYLYLVSSEHQWITATDNSIGVHTTLSGQHRSYKDFFNNTFIELTLKPEVINTL